MRGEILGIERRRRWSDDDKIAIVGSVGVDGATVTQVAQRHDVTRQQIYAWRHELKKKGLRSSEPGAVFLAVDLPTVESAPAEPTPAPSVPVELRLAGGRCLRFDSMITIQVSTETL
jgi:transposase